MDRRAFLKNLAATSAGYEMLSQLAETEAMGQNSSTKPAVDGLTLLCEFANGAETWTVYEDLRTRDGDIVFLSAHGNHRVLPKSAEAAFPEAAVAHLGLDLKDIGMSGPDLLAEKLLASGDPDPMMVKSAAPPQGSAAGNSPSGAPVRPRWDTFVGTKECSDTMPVYPSGNTRTYHPSQYVPELRAPQIAHARFDGLVGGWMPAVRKVMPLGDTSCCEVVVFGDVEAHDRFIVQTWHRTAVIEGGKMVSVFYGYSYPAFPPARQDPKPEEFYRALLVFADYWDQQLRDFAKTELPDSSWVDMAKHAFAKELMVRPGGVYPKYGAVDRDYYGPEYDGFQDIFTSAVYTNLEWGRFEAAKLIIDNYLTEFTDRHGMINMRGPETAQFGLTLSLLARYQNYTRDGALLVKHRDKVAATAKILADLHDKSLGLPRTDPGYGLIHGWSESDACLANTPAVWWQPYFANSAFAARGLADIARVWTDQKQADAWQKRSETLRERTVASIDENTWKDRNPPYVGPLPGAKLMFRDALERERPSTQQWAHRPYSELLQADILPARQANTVIDCMRACGATTLGVVANVGRARPGGRAILGFISYGYAQALLRLDRIEEYLLFLYSHRYHDHTRGSWVAGEVSGITGGTALFCIPAQQTIPLLVRWMLVLEDSDAERLYLAKGVPREWIASGKKIAMEQAPTRWGRVSFHMQADPGTHRVVTRVALPQGPAPKELHVKLRVPVTWRVSSVTVNGRAAALAGVHNDTVVITPGSESQFEIIGE